MKCPVSTGPLACALELNQQTSMPSSSSPALVVSCAENSWCESGKIVFPSPELGHEPSWTNSLAL
jgi:hypothetical protein